MNGLIAKRGERGERHGESERSMERSKSKGGTGRFTVGCAVGTERVESSITYDKREVVVYGHRQTQKKTLTLKIRVL